MSCPRCRARDGVRVPLALTLFELDQKEAEEAAGTIDGLPADPPSADEASQSPEA